MERYVTCDYCGREYIKGFRPSTDEHHKHHKRTQYVVDPSPHKHLNGTTMITPILVNRYSPKWMQKEMYERAWRFNREEGYTGIMWNSCGETDPFVHGFLFIDHNGVFSKDTIVGACSFRKRNMDGQDYWAMQWIWMCPKARRLGILTKWWPDFCKLFGSFEIEYPVSDAMSEFMKKQNYVHFSMPNFKHIHGTILDGIPETWRRSIY